MKRTLLLLILVNPLSAGEPAKKLIEWGWDEPDTKFMRANVQKMEQYPFDGLIFHVNSDKGGNFTWDMWGPRRFERAEFRQALDDLKATPFRRLTDRFLRVNVTPGNVDWWDDKAWRVVVHNFTVAAQVAREGNLKGFMFDVEQYNDQLFDYRKQKQRTVHPFADYRAKVRQRGREWVQGINSAFPDITILLTFGYSITGGPAKNRVGASYGLLADFLDGVLEGCSPRTKIVDAWEGGYPYKRRDQFLRAHETIHQKSLEWTGQPDRYRRHVRAGFGLWMDYNWRKFGWHTDDLSKNYFPPAEFEAAVRWALEVSDEYVWVYTEQPRWWTNDKLPGPYVRCLEKARQPVPRP
jgi:hypothetical protein